MDVSRMSYYVPHERVFVNSRRSHSATTLKTNTPPECNRYLTKNNFGQRNIHAIKSDSNYLLGSSIVNVNFVNNVSNLSRGFDGFRNVPMLNNPLYYKNNVGDNKNNTIIRNYSVINDGFNKKNCDTVYPFENYSYKNNADIHPDVSKKDLNVDDKMICSISNQTSRSGDISEHVDNSTPILTRNYISNLTEDVDKPKKDTKEESKPTDKFCTLKKSNELKRAERKNKLTQFLDKIKNENEKSANSQKRVKINIGKPAHEFVAKYPDPVEKELEIWHNSHNSTLKWERVKHGLYSVDGSIVHLLKLNGSLYVEGHGFKKYKGNMTILKFVEEKESRLLKEKQ